MIVNGEVVAEDGRDRRMPRPGAARGWRVACCYTLLESATLTGVDP